MRIHIVAILSALTCLVAVATAAPPPPDIDIPAEQVNGSLSQASVDQLMTWIKYYTDAIRDAKDDQTAIKARDILIAGYKKYQPVPYEYAFANAYAAVASPLLQNWPKEAGAIKGCKETTIAMAAAEMPQTSIQDLLEVMVAHPNPGVRLYGWKGYSAAGNTIAPQAAKLKTFMAALAARAAKERSPQVVAGLVRALATVNPGSDTAKILAANWDRWCSIVMSGDADMAAAASNMVQSLEMMQRTAGASDKDVHRDLLQALVDMALAAARAGDTAKKAQQDSAEPSKKQEAARTLDANKILLEYCEDALNSVSGLTKTPIHAAMKSSSSKESGDMFADIKTAVYGWKDDLKSEGVHDSDIPTPTTQATQPSQP
jgi:hypothetical protein